MGRIKHRACDMVHKPEHTADLDSGAIVQAQVRPGDAGDAPDLARRIQSAVETLEKLHGKPQEEGASHVKTLTADKGYHEARELALIQHATRLRTIMGDAHATRRRLENMEPETRRSVI